MSSSKPPTGNSNSSSSQSSSAPASAPQPIINHNGVADYFSILGIGETLQLKSTQKRLARQEQQQQQYDATNVKQTNNDVQRDKDEEEEELSPEERLYQEKERQMKIIGQEEECAMMERFYREIVELCIVSVYSHSHAANGDYIAAHLATSIKGMHRVNVNMDDMDVGMNVDMNVDGSSSVADNSSNHGSNSNTGNHHNNGNSNSNGNSNGNGNGNADPRPVQQQEKDTKSSDTDSSEEEEDDTWSSSISTPIISLCSARKKILHHHATSTNSSTSTSASLDPTEYLPREISGFQILYRTIPPNPPPDPNGSNSSMNIGSGSGLSLSQSLSMTMTNTSTTFEQDANNANANINTASASAAAAAWQKAQTFTANIHPELGYRETLLSNLKMVSQDWNEHCANTTHGNAGGGGAGTGAGVNSNGILNMSVSQSLSMSQSFHQSFDGGNAKNHSVNLSSSDNHNNNNNNNNNSNNLHSPSSNSSNNAHESKERGRGRFLNRVTGAVPSISRLKQHISLATRAKSTMNRTNHGMYDGTNGAGGDGCYDGNHNGHEHGHEFEHEQIARKEFYIGYRRRGADELNKPGVADCVLRFCRIHCKTVIQPDLSTVYGNASNGTATATGSGSGSGGGGAAGNHVGSGRMHDDANVKHANQREQGGADVNMGNTSSSSSSSSSAKHIVAQKGAAALKRGLVSGAGLAKRVAYSGKKRLLGGGGGGGGGQGPSSQTSHDPAHAHAQHQHTAIHISENNRGNDTPDGFHGIDRDRGMDSNMEQYQQEDGRMNTGREWWTDTSPDADDYGVSSVNKRTGTSTSSPQDSVFRSMHKPTVQYDKVSLNNLIALPEGFEEWVIPQMYQTIQLPVPPSPQRSPRMSGRMNVNTNITSPIAAVGDHHSPRQTYGKSSGEKRMQKTFIFNHRESPSSGDPGVGVEAFVDGNTFLHPSPSPTSKSSNTKLRNPWSPVDSPPRKFDPATSSLFPDEVSHAALEEEAMDREAMMPRLVDHEALPGVYDPMGGGDGDYEYVPLLAVRRQRVGDEERFQEDPSIVEVGMTFSGVGGKAIMPLEEHDEFEESNGDDEEPILGMTPWSASSACHGCAEEKEHDDDDDGESLAVDEFMAFGLPTFICRRNLPLGFLDTPFATRVLDRFPKKDYKGVPLPEEELPMFCYPTGCKLFRARYQDTPLPEYYGFVVKNERGDSIHVSCVSFMEPLDRPKLEQLNEMSMARRRTSLPHKLHCERQELAKMGGRGREDKSSSLMVGFEDIANGSSAMKDDMLLTGFDEMMTFEYKTICLISRYPFWSAFRRFLSHLHILSGSSSDLPLERYISHLLLTVPVPKPGGQCILIPLPAIASPMVLGLPPLKDLPLVDLSYRRLFTCLDVPTVVTIVLGFLALERKVIIMSAYPSLVSDVCELLRSLLFPFELCAPYVPRLTEPFMSCLNFPGAIFVGIHDDGSEGGLAFSVRQNIPEDTFIVDLDTGDIDCNGARFEFLKECWDIIPHQVRSSLVEEIETLCQDAKIYPGQEPTCTEIEAALDVSDVSFSPVFEDDATAPLDDRAVRDTFLRFFCSVLAGYERFLLVPDVDFLISGNEWFDTKGFLAATEKQTRGTFLQSFVTTQLFQSFIQRRTEASDVKCLLFDECLNEYHSTQDPYGRLSESTLTDASNSKDKFTGPGYELLVDQCAADLCNIAENDESSSTETSILTAHTSEGFMINNSGDLVTAPSKRNLSPGHRYVYCIDGHPHFPQELDDEMFFPAEPEHLYADFDKIPVPVLTRSDREIDVSNRRRKLAVSHRGVQRQRRCLFQLPKLMASHFFNCWLMCIPSQVSQNFQSPDQQATYLLRALGALRLLRSHHRIVPDEAGYRSLIVACGRVDSDRRQEVVKLFGLLRSDGIFPSAVTLGQYTRAIAEGYSKQSSGKCNSVIADSEWTNKFRRGSDDVMHRILNIRAPNALDFLDGNVMDLDDAGTRWRQGREARRAAEKAKVDEHYQTSGSRESGNSKNRIPSGDSDPMKKNHSTKRRFQKDWLPAYSSSSFSPHWKPSKAIDEPFVLTRDFRFVALWSRTTVCSKCSHVFLDEEIQAGWDDGDDVETESENVNGSLSDEIRCPSCGAIVEPRLGYIEMPPHVMEIPKARRSNDATGTELPSQVQNSVEVCEEEVDGERLGYVPYLSPSKMRVELEKIIEDFGEEVLEREKLRYLNPTIFFNLWWFCCRFSLPLPLAISNELIQQEGSEVDDGALVYNHHCCAFAAWDKSIAVAACHSAAKAIFSLQNVVQKSTRPTAAPEFKNLVKSFQNKGNQPPDAKNLLSAELDETSNPTASHSPLKDDFPLLASLNLQSLGEGDWDNADLSAILIKLVEACDKRDFVPAVEAVLQCNDDRRAKFGRDPNAELDCYRTLLYLTRYQCTSAFHKFFPTSSKTCKGYHFWCPNSTVSIFDRMFRDALDRLRAQGNATPIHDVSDVALGFRSVFGHII